MDSENFWKIRETQINNWLFFPIPRKEDIIHKIPIDKQST